MAVDTDAPPNESEPPTRRYLLLGGAQLAGFALIGARLFDLQVVGAARYAPLADDNRINLQVLTPKRGRIVDQFGRVLADSDELFRVTLTPALAKNVRAVLRRASHIVPLTDEDIARLAVRIRKQNANMPVKIATDVTFEQVAKLNVYAPSLPGIKTDFTWRRRYHDGVALCHIVGLVGSVERFGIEDDAVVRARDMRIGKSGAELAYDADLRGSGGTQKSEIDARGRVVRDLDTVEPVAGRDVALTIDSELQRRIAARLQSETRGAAVVINVASGRIEAMASAPGFDPDDIVGGISDAQWEKLSNAEDKPLLNRALAGLYAPGSAFVVVTALAALQSGVVTTEEHIVCTGKYTYRGQDFACSNPAGHGSVTLHDAIRSSCEYFFCEMSARLGIDRISLAARAMGLGAESSLGFVEEKPGVVPDPDWKRGNLNAGWLGGETLLTGIGQGYLQATPLQLAMLGARLASGRAVAPVLRQSDAPLAGGSDMFLEIPFKAEHVASVRAAMAAAVNDTGGSASKARLGDGKPAAAGKTGVSDIGGRIPGANAEGAKRSHALFIGFEPADAPRYAIAAVIEGGGDGDAAALLGRDILGFAIDRDSGFHKSGADGGIVPGRGGIEEAG